MTAPPGRTAVWLEDAPDHGAPAYNALARALAMPASTASVLLLGCVAAAVSIGLQGFYFAVINNSYHIPIVDGWIDNPHFASDQYIQSLRYHTSYVWPLAHQMAKWLGTYDTFLLLHVANRLAMVLRHGAAGPRARGPHARRRVRLRAVACGHALPARGLRPRRA